MLIRINGGHIATQSSSRTGSYLDVADELVGADWHAFKSVLSGFGRTDGLSLALPEDFSGFDLDVFLERVSALATQV